jgi:FMN phosphatase YigB (HAD superfamily)
MADITHAFFDYGGLIADCKVTEQTLRRAHKKAAAYLAAHGVPVTHSQLETARKPVIHDYLEQRRYHVEWPLERIIDGTLERLAVPARCRSRELLAALVDIYERNDHDVKLFPDVRKILPRIAERAELGIISNCPHASAEIELGKHGLLDLFGYRMFSCHIGVRKPLPSVYAWAMMFAGADPERSLYVSHEKSDLYGARGAGMKTLMVDRSKGETLHKLLRYV